MVEHGPSFEQCNAILGKSPNYAKLEQVAPTFTNTGAHLCQNSAEFGPNNLRHRLNFARHVRALSQELARPRFRESLNQANLSDKSRHRDRNKPPARPPPRPESADHSKIPPRIQPRHFHAGARTLSLSLPCICEANAGLKPRTHGTSLRPRRVRLPRAQYMLGPGQHVLQAHVVEGARAFHTQPPVDALLRLIKRLGVARCHVCRLCEGQLAAATWCRRGTAE